MFKNLRSLFILCAMTFFLLSTAGPVISQEDGQSEAAAPAAAGISLDGLEGSAIIFAAGDGNRRSIMVYEVGSEAPVVLSNKKGVMETQPALGPKGQTAWVRRVGGDKWELVRDGQVISKGELHLCPAFRPDGTLAAAISGDDDTSIYLFKGQTPSKFIQGEGGLAVSPTFSSDGQQVAYVSNQSGIGQIYVAAADGSNPRLLTPSAVRNTDPSWSPDGSYVVFITNETDICIIRPDGSGLRQLTRNQGVNRNPSFSPDGRKIVFTSERSGGSKLYIMDIDGSNQQILLPNFNQNQYVPNWGPVKPASLISQ